jgi:hypothetical protein
MMRAMLYEAAQSMLVRSPRDEEGGRGPGASVGRDHAPDLSWRHRVPPGTAASTRSTDREGAQKGGRARRSRVASGILVDTLGLLLNVVVHRVDVQDRDSAFHLLRRARRWFPFIERIFPDGGYEGRKMAKTVSRTGVWRLQIVKRSDVAWISRSRRLARDFERYAATVAAFVRLAMQLAANASPWIQTSRMGS